MILYSKIDSSMKLRIWWGTKTMYIVTDYEQKRNNLSPVTKDGRYRSPNKNDIRWVGWLRS
jgi:hypothetical protein